MARPSGRRAVRKAETRQRLLDAATSCFVARGYAGTTMDEIAAEAGVARSTLFNYFRRKEDLIFDGVAEDIRELIQQTVDNCRSQNAGTDETVRAIVRTMAEWYEADPVPRRALVCCGLDAGGPANAGWYATAPAFVEVIRDGQRRGDVRAGVDAEVAGRLLLDAYLGVLVRWALERGPASLKQEMVAAVDLCLRGVVPG